MPVLHLSTQAATVSNTFASKMQHLNLKKGDDNLNEVEPKFNELNQGPKLIEVSMNGEENYSDQGKKAENAPKTQESYSHFVQIHFTSIESYKFISCVTY